MKDIVAIQKQLLPDMIEVLKKRHAILHHIMLSGLIGRRRLADSLHLTERVLRAEVDFLKGQGLIEIEPAGMKISETGKLLCEQMAPFIKDLFGLTDLEEQIRTVFQLKQVTIVPGDSDQSAFVKKELGRAGARVLRQHVSKSDIVAVTGGSTMAEVANRLTPFQHKGTLFVPARGGLGERVEIQANTIASIMAQRTGGNYRLLHVPDHLSDDAYQTIILEPNIKEIIEVIRQSRIVIHGIGDAIVMAKRRKTDEQTIQNIKDEGALAEAFGYYFDRHGHVVHQIPTVGLRLEDLQHMDTVIGVAGGKSKGEAIAAIMRSGHSNVLVMDEAAAKEMLNFI